ncbi:MAG: hypothetical protein ACMUJM_24690 [bacterium]
MKKLPIIILLGLSFLFGYLFTAECIRPENTEPKANCTDEPSDIKETIYDIWVDLDKIGHYGDEGICTFYKAVKQLIDYPTLVKMIGQPIFLSGPHKNDKLILKSYNNFGHYNKEAIIWMCENLIPAANDEEFRLFTQGIYNIHISGMARTYYVALITLDNNQGFKTNTLQTYKECIQKGIYFSFHGYNDFMIQAVKAKTDYKKYNFNLYTLAYAMAFWLRRHMDGTEKEFRKGLEKLLNTYDKQFLIDFKN